MLLLQDAGGEPLDREAILANYSGVVTPDPYSPTNLVVNASTAAGQQAWVDILAQVGWV